VSDLDEQWKPSTGLYHQGREIEVDIRKMTPRSHRSFPVEGQALGEAKKFGLIDIGSY
jgi:hypothetical protein